jgi:hypothetical protein
MQRWCQFLNVMLETKKILSKDQKANFKIILKYLNLTLIKLELHAKLYPQLFLFNLSSYLFFMKLFIILLIILSSPLVPYLLQLKVWIIHALSFYDLTKRNYLNNFHEYYIDHYRLYNNSFLRFLHNFFLFQHIMYETNFHMINIAT